MKGKVRRAGRATASVAGAAGVAVGLLQLLPSILDRLHPRDAVTIAIAVTAALLTLLGDRAQLLLRRRRTQDTLLRHFPLERMSEADPLELGVFPPRTADEMPRYVERSVDSDIRGVLTRRRSVLVFGARRAGKSRTAYEAAHAVLGSREVIVPVSGEALAALIDADGFAGLSDEAILWLDDLDRFIPKLEEPAVQWLLEPDADPLIVATIRTDTYEKIIDGSGEEGGVGRRILAALDGFGLPERLTPDEMAKELAKSGVQPPVDIAVANSIEWEERYTAARAKGHTQRIGFWKRLGNWVVSAVGFVAVGVWKAIRRDFKEDRADMPLVAAISAFGIALITTILIMAVGGFGEKKKPDVGRQVERVRQTAIVNHERIRLIPAIRLRNGVKSHVIVFRPVLRKAKPGAKTTPPRPPDRLVIFDEGENGIFAGGKKDMPKPAFSFRPKGHYTVENVKTVDIDGDGQPEVVADFVLRGDPQQLRYPIAVGWETAPSGKGGRYRLSALVPQRPPAAKRIKGRGSLFDSSRFEHGVPLDPALSASGVDTAYGVSSYAVEPSAQQIAIARAVGTFKFRQTILAVGVEDLDVPNGVVQVSVRCSDLHRGGAVLIRVAPSISFEPLLRRIDGSLAQQLPNVRDEHGCHPQPGD